MRNLFKSSKPKKEQLTIINQYKELATIKKETQQWAKDNGKNIAENFVLEDAQDFDLNAFPPVGYIREEHQSKLNEVGAIYDKNLNIHKTKHNKYKNEFTNTYDGQPDIKALQEECSASLTDAFDDHNDDIEDKKAQATELKKEIRNDKTELKSLPKHNFRASLIKFSLVIAIIACGEMLLNADTFLYLGFGNRTSTAIGLAVSAVIFMIGFGQASLVRDNEKSRGLRIGGSIGLFLTVSALFLVLGYIRVSLFNSESDNEGLFSLSPFHFVGISMAFYIAICACKIYIYPRKEKIDDNNKHAVALDKLKANERKLATLKKSIFRSYEEKSKKREQVKDLYAKKINPLKETIKIEQTTIQQSALAFNTELALARNFYKQINADYKARVAELLNMLNLFSDTDNVQIVMKNLDDLNNPFEQIQLITVQTTTVSQTPKKTAEAEKTAWDVLAENQNGQAHYSFINNPKKQSL